MTTPKLVHVIGGGTRQYLDGSHLYLGSKAMGSTAKRIAELCKEYSNKMDVKLTLTNMADTTSEIDTNSDLKDYVHELVRDTRTKIVFFTASVLDFDAEVQREASEVGRLSSGIPIRSMTLTPSEKILKYFRRRNIDGCPARKDIFLVACKQTNGASEAEQYRQALLLLKRSSANLVLANDSKTKRNMIVVPEEAVYCITTDREKALQELVEIAYLRSHLTFTRSTVVDGEPVAWDSNLVPNSLRVVVDHCIARNAYKPVNGATAGHFAAKLGDTEFLTSQRKTDFNQLPELGLVRVTADGPDSVIAYGSRPSVGGQSQRIVFSEHPEEDCIVHFHCPKKEDSKVPTVSQREFECGSHECGQNTSGGLRRFGNLKAVYLENHGPNIVFNHDVDPAEVIAFIDSNFDLSQKTGGYVSP